MKSNKTYVYAILKFSLDASSSDLDLFLLLFFFFEDDSSLLIVFPVEGLVVLIDFFSISVCVDGRTPPIGKTKF